MENNELKPNFTEIHELFEYCLEIGIDARIEPFLSGFAIRFPNGADIIQHGYSYGAYYGRVELAIGCRLDYSAVELKRAKKFVKYHKDTLNKKR